MVEWHASLRVGANIIKVAFSGGSATAYGVTPAMFTTENAATQHLIEQTREFKSGRIVLLRVDRIAEPEEVVVTTVKVAEGEESPEDAEASVASGVELREVAVTCTDDAREWLMSEFGINKTKVRTRAQIDAMAASRGIKFTGI